MKQDLHELTRKEADDVASNREASDGALTVIMELRAVPVSPAGNLFDRYSLEHDTGHKGGLFWRLLLLFVLFILPTGTSIIYYGFIASDLYVSEAKYIVRSSSGNEASSLSALVQSGGFARAVDETYAVNEFMTSRSVIPLLNHDGQLRAILGRPEADPISRYPNPFTRDNLESLYRHMKEVISIEYDASTGISTLDVATFRPGDSIALADDLMSKGEAFINDLNMRANDDAMEFAEQVRDEAAARLRDVNAKLTAYRNRELIIDPNREATAALELLGKVQGDIVQQEARLSEQKALTPNNPALAAQREKLDSLTKQYKKMRDVLVGSDSSLTNKLSGYEALALQQELANKSLAAAVIGMEKARQDAHSQHVYLQNIVAPRLADYAIRPYRLLYILLTAGLSLCVYGIARTFRDTVLEHQA